MYEEELEKKKANMGFVSTGQSVMPATLEASGRRGTRQVPTCSTVSWALADHPSTKRGADTHFSSRPQPKWTSWSYWPPRGQAYAIPGELFRMLQTPQFRQVRLCGFALGNDAMVVSQMAFLCGGLTKGGLGIHYMLTFSSTVSSPTAPFSILCFASILLLSPDTGSSGDLIFDICLAFELTWEVNRYIQLCTNRLIVWISLLDTASYFGFVTTFT